jgi:hypothetical protein
MANWCYGKMTVSGRKENIKNFLLTAVKPVDRTGEILDQNLLNLTEDELGLHLNVAYKDKSYLSLNTNHRGFIDSTYIKVLSDKDNDYSLLLDVRLANYVDTNALSEIAKQYNIDIGVQATEETNEFTQTIAVNKVGKVIINDIVER